MSKGKNTAAVADPLAVGGYGRPGNSECRSQNIEYRRQKTDFRSQKTTSVIDESQKS